MLYSWKISCHCACAATLFKSLDLTPVTAIYHHCRWYCDTHCAPLTRLGLIEALNDCKSLDGLKSRDGFRSLRHVRQVDEQVRTYTPHARVICVQYFEQVFGPSHKALFRVAQVDMHFMFSYDIREGKRGQD